MHQYKDITLIGNQEERDGLLPSSQQRPTPREGQDLLQAWQGPKHLTLTHRILATSPWGGSHHHLHFQKRKLSRAQISIVPLSLCPRRAGFLLPFSANEETQTLARVKGFFQGHRQEWLSSPVLLLRMSSQPRTEFLAQ